MAVVGAPTSVPKAPQIDADRNREKRNSQAELNKPRPSQVSPQAEPRPSSVSSKGGEAAKAAQTTKAEGPGKALSGSSGQGGGRVDVTA